MEVDWSRGHGLFICVNTYRFFIFQSFGFEVGKSPGRLDNHVESAHN